MADSWDEGLQILEEISEHWEGEKRWLDELAAKMQDLTIACREWKIGLEKELKENGRKTTMETD